MAGRMMLAAARSFLHGLFFRVRNKVNKIRKRRAWRATPSHPATTYFADTYQLFEPLCVGPSSLTAACVGGRAVRGVLDVLAKLESEPYARFVSEYYRHGLAQCGDRWVYADLSTVLFGVTTTIPIESYLEIGVRRGRSLAIVGATSPRCAIVGFDLWVQNYAGVENPGPDFVRAEVAKVGHNGALTLVDGDSKQTVPDYFRDHPNAYFDLVTVDGDHSLRGATVDLLNVIPRIKVGGVLVFDDICSQEHPYLQGVWQRQVVQSGRFACYSFTEVGLGVAFGIKRY